MTTTPGQPHLATRPEQQPPRRSRSGWGTEREADRGFVGYEADDEADPTDGVASEGLQDIEEQLTAAFIDIVEVWVDLARRDCLPGVAPISRALPPLLSTTAARSDRVEDASTRLAMWANGSASAHLPPDATEGLLLRGVAVAW